MTRAARSPKLLLAVTGAFAAIFTNDVVVFVLTPPLIVCGLVRHELDPRPYLIGHAGAANARSAATLVGKRVKLFDLARPFGSPRKERPL